FSDVAWRRVTMRSGFSSIEISMPQLSMVLPPWAVVSSSEHATSPAARVTPTMPAPIRIVLFFIVIFLHQSREGYSPDRDRLARIRHTHRSGVQWILILTKR